MRLIQWIPKSPNGIAIVGEAPGREEMNQGKPFCGPEGRYLSKLLNAAGISKADCFITNVVHQQPPKNIFDKLPQSVIESGKVQLQEDLSNWRPHVIIALGAKALEALTEKKSIFKARGAISTCTLVEGLKVLPSIHPGGLIKGHPKYEPIVIGDLKKAKEESAFPEIRYPERDIKIIGDISDAEALLESLSDIPDKVACDIESIGTSGIMTAYGIAISRNEAFSITMECLKSPRVLRALSRFCDSSTPKIFHNALFDVLHGALYYNIHTRNIFADTMIKQHAAMPVFEKSLGFCASIYTNEPYWKDDGKDFFKELKIGRGDWEQLYVYNGKDCCLTYEICEEQDAQLDYWQTWDVYERMMDLIYPSLRAMYEGFRVNHEKVNEFAEENEKAIENLYKIFYKSVGNINVRSTPQKKTLFYEVWGLPKQYDKGKVTTSTKAIEKLERFPTKYKPTLGLIRVMGDYLKRRDFYRLKLDNDGRIRYALKITGAYTGRMSSSKSITGSGSNFQNQPKRVRKFYEPDPGKIFIQVDLSQAEARVVAALCKDEQWLKEFDEVDLHTKVASQLYNIPPEKVRKGVERQIAKRVAHASHYLLGWYLLSQLLKCSAKEAKAHKAKYFEIRPKLLWWHDKVRKTIREKKMIRTCYGRTIQFPGMIDDKVIRDAVAAEPQSTSAEYLNEGLRKIYNEGPEEFEYKLQVHDSILCQVPDDISIIKRNIFAMKDLIEETIYIDDIPLLIPTDFEIGYNWLEMEEMKTIDSKAIESTYESLQG